ncbi:MAG: hypothetical protein FWG31_07280 [Oscillospiraceae bacterium]|nr:hypothetical protein [Oscillospiraceae bacterium]
MSKTLSAVEKVIETAEHGGTVLEVVERPSVVWVGTLTYAEDISGEPDSGALLKRYQDLAPAAPKIDTVNDEWDACININFNGGEKAKGMMFGQETASPDKQDKRYDLFTQPAGLYMRIYNDQAAAKLLGKDKCETWELFGVLREAAGAYGYVWDAGNPIEVEYHNRRDNSWYAYLPVRKTLCRG